MGVGVCALSQTTQVAYKLMVMHEECLEGKFQIESLREANKQKVSVHRVKQVIIYVESLAYIIYAP